MTPETPKSDPAADVLDWLIKFAGTKNKPKPPPPKPEAIKQTERETRFARITNSRWKDEALALIVSEATCSCGAKYEYPHPQLFIRRFHPQYGIHFEALNWRPRYSTLPLTIEREARRIDACHKCFTQTDVELSQAQLSLNLEMQQ